MKTIGIIAEFNPFHNGHAYLIQKAKEITGADHVVIIMSGNYVQRGAPAFLNKFLRTKAALLNQADLVIELPVCYSMSSASYFATGAVEMLDQLNIIDYLCFGSESDDLKTLHLIADTLLNEDQVYKDTLLHYQKNGMSYCRSRENAVIKSLSMKGIPIKPSEISKLLSSPNSILAIEYLLALKRCKSKITPVPIKRIDNGYHSEMISNNLASASAIRKLFTKHDIITFNNINETLSEIVPINTLPVIKDEYKVSYPITSNDYSTLIGNVLISCKYDKDVLYNLFDTSKDLANRLFNSIDVFNNFDDYINNNNSTIFTSSRISRILFYLLIEYDKNDFQQFKNDGYVYYYRILGFKKSSTALLAAIKTHCALPVFTKLSTVFDQLDEYGLKMLNMSLKADEIYRMVSMCKYNSNQPTEYQQGVVML